MIFYYFVITLCMTSIVHCADKTPERTARIKQAIPIAKKFENKEEKERMQHKKNSVKLDNKRSLNSLTGSSEEVLEFLGEGEIDEDLLDRIMT